MKSLWEIRVHVQLQDHEGWSEYGCYNSSCLSRAAVCLNGYAVVIPYGLVTAGVHDVVDSLALRCHA
jgi:hypothetical protein